jgi:hypothetical protein
MGRSSWGVRARSRRTGALAAVLVLVMGVTMPAGAAARTVREPVLMVHGHSPTARADCDGFDALARQLRSPDAGHARYRFTGELVPVAYYGGDTRAAGDGWGDADCRWWAHVSNYGDHARVAPSGHQRRRGITGHTSGTSIRHLAHHLAWFIHDRYSRRSVTVDLVGSSMGGLLIRYALAASAARSPGFPRRLLVDDVVTLGTPFGGHETELFTSRNRQTREMDKDSTFMAWLHEHALAPPRAGGRTDWTFIGSEMDGLIPTSSTVGLRCTAADACERWQAAQHYVIYGTRPTQAGPRGVAHGMYHRTTGYAHVYQARIGSGGTWSETDSLVPPVRLIEWALARDDW